MAKVQSGKWPRQLHENDSRSIIKYKAEEKKKRVAACSPQLPLSFSPSFSISLFVSCALCRAYCLCHLLYKYAIMCTLGDAQCVSPGDGFAAAAAAGSRHCIVLTRAYGLSVSVALTRCFFPLFFAQPKDTAVWQLLTLMIAIIMLGRGEKNPNWIHNVVFFDFASVCLCVNVCVWAKSVPRGLKNASQKAARSAKVNQKHSSENEKNEQKQRQRGSAAGEGESERGEGTGFIGNCMWLATVAVLPKGRESGGGACCDWQMVRLAAANATRIRPVGPVPFPVPHSAFGMGVMRIRNSCGYSNNARLVNFKAAPFTVLLFQVFSLSLALCFFVSTAAHAACVARLRFPCAFSPFSFYCFPLVIVSSKLYGFVAGCAGSILWALWNNSAPAY